MNFQFLKDLFIFNLNTELTQDEAEDLVKLSSALDSVSRKLSKSKSKEGLSGEEGSGRAKNQTPNGQNAWMRYIAS